jgi:hypothetical protein
VSDAAEKQRVWELFKSTPEPYGYNPAMFWPDGPGSPGFGVMKLTPWRIELYSLADLAQRKPARVWRSS